MPRQEHRLRGFTLIELSIVLVIIGLIVGGVLVGQELIVGATVRAQITQIQKYNIAANTFRTKYTYLPGDIATPAATMFGFATRGPYKGQGDGNGILEGVSANADNSDWGFYEGAGETAMFWVDLTAAKMMDGSFTTASPTTPTGSDIYIGGGLQNYLPTAKIANTLLVYVYSNNLLSAVNYFGLSGAYMIQGSGCASCLGSGPGLSVVQAYNIDKKIDDGFPQNGKVTAQYNNFGPTWAGPSDTSSTAGSATTCYDNNSTLGAVQQYSTKQNGGNGLNCALSFQFQ